MARGRRVCGPRVGSGRPRRLAAPVLSLCPSPDGSGDVDGPDPAPAGGRGGRARPSSVPSWVSVVGRDFGSPLSDSLHPGREVGTGSGRPGCPVWDGLGPGRAPWSGPARLVGSASLTVPSSVFLWHVEAKSPSGDSDGPVPLPAWTKRGGRPRPAPPLSVSAPPLWPPRAPAPLPVDQMTPPPPQESSGPGVYGAALGTGGRDKVPGALPASRRWAPLSAAVISSPLIGLFCHQVSADTVSFGVCHRGLWVSGRTRGSGLLGRQLVPGSALAAGAARLGLCAGSCVVSSG